MEERVWLFGDYKQAESRVVAWRAPEARLKAMFSSGADVHLEIAKSIGKVVQENRIKLPDGLFSKPDWREFTAKNKAERQAGKTAGHAGNYGIAENTLSIFLGMPVAPAKIILAIYHTQFPQIKLGYQAWIRNCIHKSRSLTTPLGFTRVFFDMINDDLYRKAYAFYGQSTIGDLTMRTINKLNEHFRELNFNDGVIWTPAEIRSCGFDVRLDAHDGIGISLPLSDDLLRYTAKRMKEYAEIPLSIDGEELIIPMDFKVGRNWGDLHDYDP